MYHKCQLADCHIWLLLQDALNVFCIRFMDKINHYATNNTLNIHKSLQIYARNVRGHEKHKGLMLNVRNCNVMQCHKTLLFRTATLFFPLILLYLDKQNILM